MVHRRFLVAGMILFLLTMVRIERTEATALGLADGSYTISIDIQQGGNLHDGSGTMMIGATGITAFHVSITGGTPDFPPSSLDCSGCAVGSTNPDEVEVNGAGTNTFQILDIPSDASWQLLTAGQIAHVLDDGNSFADGTWTAVLVSPPQVPEPSSLILLLLGLSALGLRRLRAKRD